MYILRYPQKIIVGILMFVWSQWKMQMESNILIKNMEIFFIKDEGSSKIMIIKVNVLICYRKASK